MQKSNALVLDSIIKSFHENIRAEVFVAELHDSGFPTDTIEVVNQGGFFRPFRNDVSGGKAIEMSSNEYIYHLFLSRNGLYDVLPEGLLHSQDKINDSKRSVKKFIGYFKRRKKEEKEAREFFKPFENEIFNTRVELEKSEKGLLCLQRSHFFNFLTEFWNLDSELPMLYQQLLLNILPYAHQVAGNFELIKNIIAKSLKLNVEYKLFYRRENSSSTISRLGNKKLGEDSILGSYTAPLPYIVFSAGEISTENITDYINNGIIAQYINTLFEYLIPIEFDVKIEWKTTALNQIVNQKGIGYLGYTISLHSDG